MSVKLAQNKGRGRKKNDEMGESLSKNEDFAHYIFPSQDKGRRSFQISPNKFLENVTISGRKIPDSKILKNEPKHT